MLFRTNDEDLQIVKTGIHALDQCPRKVTLDAMLEEEGELGQAERWRGLVEELVAMLCVTTAGSQMTAQEVGRGAQIPVVHGRCIKNQI